MKADLFDQIRNACRAVSRGAKHVRIREDRIDAYAASLSIERAIAPSIDPATHYLGEPTDTLAFFLTLDAINFGSGYFPHLRKREGMSGYFTVASSLAEHYRAHGPIAPQKLAVISAEACAELFGQDLANAHVAELMNLFRNALNQLGELVCARFGGLYTGLVESANHSAEKLVTILTEMPYFRDVERYGELAAADLSLALKRQGLGRFDDLDGLTIFADNLVPHVLRMDEILEYTPELADQIDREELIPPGSEEEIEIRSCALDAVERIGQSLRAKKTAVTSMGLDYVLWNRGQEKHYKKMKPRHRTRTVYY
jgi:hypothetical protein